MAEEGAGSASPSAGAKPRIATQGCGPIPLIVGTAWCNEHTPIGSINDWDHRDTKSGMQFLGYREA